MLRIRRTACCTTCWLAYKNACNKSKQMQFEPNTELYCIDWVVISAPLKPFYPILSLFAFAVICA